MEEETQEHKTKTSEPYYPDGGYGWIIVCAIVLINISLLTLVPCFGIIFADEFKVWGITSAQSSFLLHLHSSLYCTFGFFTSPFLKFYGMKPVALIGSALMCTGMLLSSFATSYIYLIFSTSVLIGVGQGIVMPATYLAVYTYFKKRLTIATSLTVTSASLSSIVIPKICEMLLPQVGRRNTVLLLFFISLSSFLGCLLLKPVKRPDDKNDLEEEEECIGNPINGKANRYKENIDSANKELLQQSDKILNGVYEPTTIPAKKKSSIFSKLHDIFDLHLLRNVHLVIMIVGLGISFAAELNIILMLQFMLKELSAFDLNHIATAVIIQSVADILGRLVVPMITHFFNAPAKLMYASALVFATIGRTVLALWPMDRWVVFGVVALVGLMKGVRAVFQSVVLPKYVALDKIAAANGINMLFTGCVSLAIGPLIGVVSDVSNSPVYALHAASFLSMLCVLMWIIEYIFLESQSKETVKTS